MIIFIMTHLIYIYITHASSCFYSFTKKTDQMIYVTKIVFHICSILAYKTF